MTYGLRDDLDLSVTVPLVYSRFGLDVESSPVNPDFPSELDRHAAHASNVGVGDVFLRVKYLVRGEYPRLAAGLVARLPASNEKNFQGTGETEIAPLLYASTPSFAAPHIRLQGYANAGIGVNASEVGRSEGRYGVGLDCHIGDRFTAATAVLGRHPFERQSAEGVFDLPRCPRSDAVQGRCGRGGAKLTAPFLGLRGNRPDFYDLSVGARMNLWRDRLLGFVDVILPINDDGFRADVIPLAGVEMTF